MVAAARYRDGDGQSWATYGGVNLRKCSRFGGEREGGAGEGGEAEKEREHTYIFISTNFIHAHVDKEGLEDGEGLFFLAQVPSSLLSCSPRSSPGCWLRRLFIGRSLFIGSRRLRRSPPFSRFRKQRENNI
jgi:hypothetical protein